MARLYRVLVPVSDIEAAGGERSFYAAGPFGNNLCFVDRDAIFTG